ncbi:ParM/StbA family protein [Halonatronum saccharophilum]|uniref:ParM/StbA family protein n=1 Tax=Halonatronum saccharophilum TaxID=150060 RepID=UPI0004832E33|nr:ParM/StbA family protein [Halonatronum saccharophilum]
MRKDNIKYAGIDLGYDTIKLITDQMKDSSEGVLKLPSLVEEINDELDGLELNKEFSKQNAILTIDGVTYGVGDYVISQFSGIGANYRADKFNSDSELAKLLVGFSILHPQANEIVVDSLATGLPVKYYEKYKEDLKKRFEGEFKATINDKEIKYNFKNVTVLPQGVASLAYYINQDKSFDFNQEKCPVLDIGGLTTDAVYYNKGVLVKGSTFSMEKGMSNVFKSMAKELVLDEKLIRDAVIAKEERISLNTGDVDLKEAKDEACQNLAALIVNYTYNEWRDFIDTIDSIFLVGGGAEILKDHLSQKFENIKLEKIMNAQEANVLAYLLRAEAIYNKLNKEG